MDILKGYVGSSWPQVPIGKYTKVSLAEGSDLASERADETMGFIAQIAPSCGLVGEWCDFQPKAEFDVRDDYGRWYAARVCFVGPLPDSEVRFSLYAWDGTRKSSLCVPRCSTRIAPAGRQNLVGVDTISTDNSEIASITDVSDLEAGARVQVNWQANPLLPGEWYGAIVLSDERDDARRSCPVWHGWFRLDFDGWHSAEYFDLSLLARKGQLRLDNRATPVEQTRYSCNLSREESTKQHDLHSLCMGKRMLGKRVAVMWPSENDVYFRGTVIECDQRKFKVRYDDDAEEYWEHVATARVLFLEHQDFVCPSDVSNSASSAIDGASRPDSSLKADTKTTDLHGATIWYRCVSVTGEVWCAARLCQQIAAYPGWWKAQLRPDSAIACSDDAQPLCFAEIPLFDQGCVEVDLLVRPGNFGWLWWRHQAQSQRSSGPCRGNEDYSQSASFASLVSPSPPWEAELVALRAEMADSCCHNEGAEIPHNKYTAGDCVYVRSSQAQHGALVRINAVQHHTVECQWLRRGSDTILGSAWDNTADNKRDIHGCGAVLTTDDVKQLVIGSQLMFLWLDPTDIGHNKWYRATLSARCTSRSKNMNKTRWILDFLPAFECCDPWNLDALAAKCRLRKLVREVEERFLCRKRHILPTRLLDDNKYKQPVYFGSQPPSTDEMQGRLYCWRVYDEAPTAHFNLNCGPSFEAIQPADLVVADSSSVKEQTSATKAEVQLGRKKFVSSQIIGMDLFCGVGGLSEGLKRAGVSMMHGAIRFHCDWVSRWKFGQEFDPVITFAAVAGVDADPVAACSWEINNPSPARAWNTDVQELLARIDRGEPGLPAPDSVDVLVMGVSRCIHKSMLLSCMLPCYCFSSLLWMYGCMIATMSRILRTWTGW
jgi:hypothetical protein